MAEEKYSEAVLKTLDMFRDNPAFLTSRGIVSDTKLSKLLGVSRETIRRWKRPVAGFEKYYQKKFAAKIEQLQSRIDTGEIKRSMVERAKGFTQKKVVKELKEVTQSDGTVVEKMVITKKEQITQAGDVNAARLVLANIDKSWDVADLQRREHGVTEETAELLKALDGTSKGKLPQRNEIEEAG